MRGAHKLLLRQLGRGKAAHAPIRQGLGTRELHVPLDLLNWLDDKLVHLLCNRDGTKGVRECPQGTGRGETAPEIAKHRLYIFTRSL